MLRSILTSQRQVERLPQAHDNPLDGTEETEKWRPSTEICVQNRTPRCSVGPLPSLGKMSHAFEIA
jgi:hypothetical protein